MVVRKREVPRKGEFPMKRKDRGKGGTTLEERRKLRLLMKTITKKPYSHCTCVYQGVEMLVFQKILCTYLMDDPYSGPYFCWSINQLIFVLFWNMALTTFLNQRTTLLFRSYISIIIVRTPAHTPPPTPPLLGDGGGLSHFSERSYRRDFGQIGILGGNWHFRWGWFVLGGTSKLPV